MKTKSIDDFMTSPRVRFNSGFHDATFDKERGNNRIGLTEFNGKVYPLCSGGEWKYYRLGYQYGQNENISNGRPETSEMAWEKYQDNIDKWVETTDDV